MADVRSTLQASLGSQYTLERELGGGGMSRVFVADEMALGRKVVVKVLQPELAAGVNIDRFNREIHLAAQIQHPCIVPVLAAGTSAGLPYYTMPFVDGESLRTCLARTGPLSPSQTIRIMRDVAGALCAAHERGVVHRDIKPDNILLTRHHALVTDFGVAKALSASAEPRDGMLTTLGIAMGTPAYMAPEQAAADPAVDHRADIYALGAVAYEMLTGTPMFGKRAPSALLAAHVTETPVPVGERAPDTPPALADLVMRCVAKNPADRPQSADELLSLLDAVTTPGGESTLATAVPRARARRRFPRPAIAALAVLILLGVAALSLRALGVWPRRTLISQGVLGERDPILVADFRVTGGDTSLGPVVAEALRTDLSQSHVVTVVQSSAVGRVLARMQRPPDSRVDLQLGREIAARDGIKAVIGGDIAAVGGGYVLTAQLVDPETGDALASFREDANEDRGIIPAINRLSNRLRTRIGESLRAIRATAPLEQVTTPSLAALRKYTQGAHALDGEGDIPKAIALLGEAVRLDTAFAMAYRKLGVAYQRQGDRPAQQFAMFQKAYDYRDHLTDRERYLTEGSYYALGGKYDLRKSLAAYEALLDIDPQNQAALNNAALHYYKLRDYPRAISYFKRAIAADTTASLSYGNVIDVQIDAGRVNDARASATELARRFPKLPESHFGAAKVAYAVGDYDTAAREVTEFRAARPQDPNTRSVASNTLALLAVLRGRLADGERLIREAAAADRERGVAAGQLAAQLRLAFLDIWFRGNDERGIARIDQALKDTPLSSMPAPDRPYLDLADNYAVAGRTDRARALVAEYDRVENQGQRSEQVSHRRQSDGVIALMERRYADALTAFRMSDSSECAMCVLPLLAYTFDRAGNSDSARIYYERYVTTPSAERLYIDAWFLAGAHKRLGEMYEQRNDRDRAAQHYEQFLKLWQNADPELRPRVDDVRRRLMEVRPVEPRRTKTVS